METPLTCALCDSLGSKDPGYTSITNEAKTDHARIHVIQSKILDDRITEDETLQRCFIIGQPKVECPAPAKSECRQLFLDLCNSLLKRQSKCATAICNVCGFGLCIKGKTYSMVCHASAHLEVRLFTCRHCDSSSSTIGSVRQHIRLQHHVEPTNMDYEDRTVEQFDEICNQIKRCFSSDYPRATGVQRQFVIRNDSQDNCQRSVIDLCRSIFLQRSKPASIDCNLCGSRIVVRQIVRLRLQAGAMYQHAAAHMDVKLFPCRHCDLSMSSKSAIRRHLKNTHQIVNGNNDDFDDQSNKFQSVYLDTIKRCFSADQVKLEGAPTRDSSVIKAEASIRNRTTGSKLTIERHSFYNRLIRKIVASDWKVKCSLCSKRFTVKMSDNIVGLGAFFHAEMHLRKPLYRCKVCGSSFCTRLNVAQHLRTRHALGLQRNYERVGDEFHNEIMAMLSKCYDPQS